MKTGLLAFSLLAAVFRPAFARAHGLEKRADDHAGDNGSDKSTIFNDMRVPPMKELNAAELEESIKDGYWFVKYFSPYCPFCEAIKPTWQTLYEFYYTSNPLKSSTSKQAANPESSLNSFQAYYNFHFASMDCVVNGDKCREMEVLEWPTFALYHNGKLVEKYKGEKKMQGLSSFIEKRLESIKPGSRPRTEMALPEPGAKKSPEQPKSNDNPLTGEGNAKPGNSSPALSKQPGGSQKGSDTDMKRLNPNPQGISVPLTAESFQKLVTTTRDPWFVKFYAPWCAHCQALAPVWSQMAKDLKGKLNIGEVDCEVEKRLCKDARVNVYPTMYFFRGGERVEYEGLRGLGDLVSYAKKAVDVVGLGVQYVDATSFKKMEETEEVIFLYFFDHATTSEDFAALDRLTLSLVGRARLVKTNSTVLAERFKISTWPRLLVSRDGRPSYYTALAPKDMRDFRQVLAWMQKVWLPIVAEMTASNAREIMEGKYVVLGILNRQRSDEFIQDKRELKNAALEWMEKQTKLFQLERQELRDAKELRIEEADDRDDQRALRAAKNTRIMINEDDKKQVAFAWIDGIFWDRWIRTTYGIDVRNGERVIINDEENELLIISPLLFNEQNRRYWDTTPNGGFIVPSRTSILETITHVVSSPNKLKSKSTVGTFESLFSIGTFTFSHPILSFILFVAVLFIVSFWVRSKLRKGRPAGGLLGSAGGNSGGFFHLDGKEGLLGGGGGGKVD
ncbi:protein disulfide isomerase family protein [Emydomyces testavorans]|uniref:Protein disulfide isomerase family protein n=1 Tax=Emydomyces testavorans TaxID=2070801 RepID=A0AAF0IKI6_9EURO|nr:protein disulfide isomerase family protein [Emydomyces testavorans]